MIPVAYGKSGLTVVVIGLGLVVYNEGPKKSLSVLAGLMGVVPKCTGLGGLEFVDLS